MRKDQTDMIWNMTVLLLGALVLFSLFKSRLFPLLLRLFRPEGFLQLILCRSMAETLMVLGILLLLRHLPGIHIGSLAAYTFALFWGGTGLTMRLWGEWKRQNRE